MRISGWLVVGLAGTLASSPAFAETDTKTIQVSATILPRLELSIIPDTGRDITFGAIEQPAEGDLAQRTVKVKLGVFSNLGAPYHVTQLVRQPLTSLEGRTVADEQFTVSAHDAALGQVHTAGQTAITAGHPMTLYTSNTIGKSDQFLADYTLHVTPTTPAGEFNTEIVYTVTSL